MRTAQVVPKSLCKLAVAAAVGTLAAVVAVGVSVAPVQADPADVSAQLDKASNDLEVIVEKYNKTREYLKKSRAQAAQLNKQLAPMQKQVDAISTQVGALASAAYRGGHASAMNALLQSGSPTTLIAQMSTLDQLARMQNRQISRLNEAKATLDVRKKSIDALVAKQARAEKTLGAQKAKIQRDVDRLENMLGGASRSSTRTDYGPPPNVSGSAGVAVRFAYAQLGKPYAWGASGPGSYDCSGLTMAAWNAAGVSLPHNAADQYYSIAHISRSALAPGDLVFFYSDIHHVGMYVGNGNMVHSSTYGQPVAIASIDSQPIFGFGRPH